MDLEIDAAAHQTDIAAWARNGRVAHGGNLEFDLREPVASQRKRHSLGPPFG